MLNDPTGEIDEADEAIKIIEESGDELQAAKLKLARAERTIAREKAARMSAEATGYKAELLTEFPYADADSITGKSKAEMRASAERVHSAVEKVIAKNGLTPQAAAKNAEDPRKAEWGTPPPLATEVITESPIDFAGQMQAARTGLGPDGKPMDRNAVIRANMEAPRQIERKTIAGVLGGQR